MGKDPKSGKTSNSHEKVCYDYGIGRQVLSVRFWKLRLIFPSGVVKLIFTCYLTVGSDRAGFITHAKQGQKTDPLLLRMFKLVLVVCCFFVAVCVLVWLLCVCCVLVAHCESFASCVVSCWLLLVSCFFVLLFLVVCSFLVVEMLACLFFV